MNPKYQTSVINFVDNNYIYHLQKVLEKNIIPSQSYGQKSVETNEKIHRIFKMSKNVVRVKKHGALL